MAKLINIEEWKCPNGYKGAIYAKDNKTIICCICQTKLAIEINKLPKWKPKTIIGKGN